MCGIIFGVLVFACVVVCGCRSVCVCVWVCAMSFSGHVRRGGWEGVRVGGGDAMRENAGRQNKQKIYIYITIS